MNGMKGMDEQRETVRLEHAQAARMYNVDRIDACISTGQSRYENPLPSTPGCSWLPSS